MIKYFDLQRISDSFEPEISDVIIRVLRSGWYLQGEENHLFEKAFADYLFSFFLNISSQRS